MMCEPPVLHLLQHALDVVGELGHVPGVLGGVASSSSTTATSFTNLGRGVGAGCLLIHDRALKWSQNNISLVSTFNKSG